jgi:transposase-like protein
MKISATSTTSRHTYTLAAKRSIIAEAYALPLSVKSVARKYNVQPNQIRRWKRNFTANGELNVDGSPDPATLQTSCVRRRTRRVELCRQAGAGRKCLFSDKLIAELKDFFEKSRDEDFSISLRLMMAQAKLLSPETTLMVANTALESRIYRLLRKWDVSWRRGTHKAQNTRYSSEIMEDFHSYIRMKIKLLGVDCCAVYNADETNVYFSPQHTCTYAPRGSRTVAIKGSDSSSRCTVMLGASMAGEKLPPFLIFKGKNNRSGHIKRELNKKSGLPDQMEYGVQDRAWMDEILMLEWIEKVWRPATQHNRFSYLILDECRSHLTVKVKAAFASCNTELDLIPAGYTSRLQPMDVGTNKPFKGYVSDSFTDWLIVNRNKKPTRQDVAAWINSAWIRLSEDTVRSSFRGSGYYGKAFSDDDDESVLEFDPLGVQEPAEIVME